MNISFIALWLFETLASFSQGKTLINVRTLTPEIGYAIAFEAAWKAHAAKYHTVSDKRSVFEILSGPRTGAYLLVQFDLLFADLDKYIPNKEILEAEVKKKLDPSLESSSGVFIRRYSDTLCFNNKDATA